MLEEDANVMTALVDCPGRIRAPSLSQLIVMGPFAVVGFQLLVEIFNVRDVPVPVFLTYTVLVMLLPGVISPQSIAERLLVPLLSVNRPKFGVTFIEPVEDKRVLTEIAP